MNAKRKPDYFPQPNRRNKKIVADAMTKAEKKLSTGKSAPLIRVQEIMCEPGILYTHAGDPAECKEFRPTKFDDLLAANQGYHAFLSSANLLSALRRYVVIFAHGDLYQDAPRHALMIRKPANSSLHPGMLNLPGGRCELNEHPKDAAVREFYEETGWQCQQPQLMGLLLPSMFDFVKESPYIVYCYRGIIRTADKQTAKDDAHHLNIEQHEPMWYLIQDLGLQQIVPNIIAVLPHMASESRCWIIQDCWRCDDFLPTKDPNFNAQVPPRLRCRTQEIITYYTPDRTLEARMNLKPKRRIET